MKKILIPLFLLIVSLSLTATTISAAKLRVRTKSTVPSIAPDLPKGVVTLVSLRGDRKALEITLSNFKNISRVDYRLTYLGDGLEQAVLGTIMPSSDVTQREMPFGTCSGGNCTYYASIKNMHLNITSNLSSGTYTKVIQPYRIKI